MEAAHGIVGRHDEAVERLAAAKAEVDEAARRKQTARLDAAIKGLEAAVFEAREARVAKEVLTPAQISLTQARASRRKAT